MGKYDDMTFDDGDFLIEHHMARRIDEILCDKMYHEMSAITVVGVLTTLATTIAIEGYMGNMEADEGEGDGWKEGSNYE